MIIYFLGIYAIFIYSTIVVYDFLFINIKLHSPYEFLKRRRSATENFDQKVNYYGTKVLIILAILMYCLFAIYFIARQFSAVAELIYLYDAIMKDYGLPLYGLSFTFLAIESFFKYKAKGELSEFFYERKHLNGVRLASFVTGIFSALLLLVSGSILPEDHNLIFDLGYARTNLLGYSVSISFLLLVLHIALLLFAIFTHIRFDVRNVKYYIVMNLTSSEPCKICLRNGSKELKLEILSSILEYYDIYSKKILGRWLFRLTENRFASPAEDLFFHDGQHGHNRRQARFTGPYIDSDVNIIENGQLFYKRARLRFYLKSIFVLVCQIVLLALSILFLRGLIIIIAILPSAISCFLFIYSLKMLNQKSPQLLNKFTLSYFPEWTYIFKYEFPRDGGDSTVVREKICAREGKPFLNIRNKEISYVSVIESFLEYVRQIEMFGDENNKNKIFREIAEHVSRIEGLDRYEMSQYRSLLILYNFAVRQEERMLNDSNSLYLNVTSMERNVYEYCTDKLSTSEKLRLHNFLYDITLDYYGVVDIDAANNQIDTTSRRYEANKYFEDYWKILSE